MNSYPDTPVFPERSAQPAWGSATLQDRFARGTGEHYNFLLDFWEHAWGAGAQLQLDPVTRPSLIEELQRPALAQYAEPETLRGVCTGETLWAAIAPTFADTHGGLYFSGAETIEQGQMAMSLHLLGLITRYGPSLRPHSSAVDLGSGTGAFSTLLGLKGMDVLGVNVSQAQLAKARERGARAGVEDRVRFVLADAAHVELVSYHPDAIVAFESLFHMDRERVIREAASALQAGGILVLTDADFHGGGVGAAIMKSAFHVRDFMDRESYIPLLTSCGFRDITITDLNPYMKPLMDKTKARLVEHRPEIIRAYGPARGRALYGGMIAFWDQLGAIYQKHWGYYSLAAVKV